MGSSIESLQSSMKSHPTYIYESPDGGSTVYRRNIGTNQRELVKGKEKFSDLLEDKQWGQIRRAANNDPILQNMLDQIKVYWHLKNIP